MATAQANTLPPPPPSPPTVAPLGTFCAGDPDEVFDRVLRHVAVHCYGGEVSLVELAATLEDLRADLGRLLDTGEGGDPDDLTDAAVAVDTLADELAEKPIPRDQIVKHLRRLAARLLP
jgi:hypothetical protein